MSNNSKQRIYQRIRETSMEEYIYSEMLRIGFLKDGEGKSTELETLLNKKIELIEKAKQSELFKKILEKFPDANLVNVDKIKNED